MIPILETLYCKQWTRLDGLGALVITPTRELAYQIYETLRKIGRYHDVSAGLIIGGKDLQFEKKRMDQCNIVICTPGRLLQHMDENPLFDCVNMQILVLDEADRCLDMGFEKTMNSIIENLPPKRRTLLFSATQTKSVRDLARLSLKDPMYVSAHEHAAHTTPEGLQQSYVICNLEDKMAMLWSFIRNHLKQKVIVFFSSCKQVKYVYESFCRMKPGVSLLALYGTLHQLKRMSIYESFCTKQYAVLFATDIAARGLDFPSVNWVVQMDCPEDANSYIHRAGRTARFQRGGESLLVLLPSELEMIERLKEHKVPIAMIKINPNKLHSPQCKLEAMLARDVALKETAQRAFVAYIKSVFLMKDKKIFDVHALNTDSYARSLGLAIPPRIRFLQKMQKTVLSNQESHNIVKRKKEKSNTVTEDDADLHAKLVRKQEYDNDQTASDSDDSINDNSVRKQNETKIEENGDTFFGNDESDDEDILKVKRVNIQIEDILSDSTDEIQDQDISLGMRKKKAITKAAVAKRILKKNIIPNKKTTFDEDGQQIMDSAKSKVSTLAKEYEGEEGCGIDIEKAKEILREEDRFDKQRFRDRIKEKHRELKRKLKASKKQESETEEELANSGNSDSDSDSYQPDLSWLPDPDKIYGKKDDLSEEISDSNSEEIEQIHRPSKRKLITQKEQGKVKKKQKLLTTDDNLNLKEDEELALQLLRD